MALTNWKALTSQGVISDTPASGFRYRYGADFVVYLEDAPGALAAVAWSAVGAGVPVPGMHTVKVPMRWKLHIEDPNGTKLFEQEVKMDLWFVAMIMSMMGGVAFSLFTWWIHEGSDTIKTTICDGKTLAEGEKPRTLGAEVGFNVPAGGSDYTSNYATILNEWTSPIYYCQLPAGSRFKITFHNVGYSSLRSSLSSIQTQVMEATGAFRRLPGFGMVVGARAGSGGMEAHAWHAPAGRATPLRWEAPQWTSGVGSSGGRCVWVPYVGGGRVALLWEGNGAILYAESCNLGDVNGWEGPATVLPGHTLLGADRDTDGVLYVLTRNPAGATVGYKLSRSLNREALVSVGPPIACRMRDSGEALSLTSVDHFEVERGVCHVMVDRGTSIDYYQGLDGMASWVLAEGV